MIIIIILLSLEDISIDSREKRRGEREGEGERQGNINVKETSISCFTYAPDWGQARKL